MRVGTYGFVGERLTEAREARGYTNGQLENFKLVFSYLS